MVKCGEPGCERAHRAKGLCFMHYQQKRYRERLDVREDFSRRAKSRRAREEARARDAELKRARRARDPEKAREEGRRRGSRPSQCLYRRQWATGMPVFTALFLRSEQRGQCAICSVPMVAVRHKLNSENWDHCHKSGQPRGLLCSACNTSLGVYEKSQRPAGLRLLAYEAYLISPPVSILWGQGSTTPTSKSACSRSGRPEPSTEEMNAPSASSCQPSSSLVFSRSSVMD